MLHYMRTERQIMKIDKILIVLSSHFVIPKFISTIKLMFHLINYLPIK